MGSCCTSDASQLAIDKYNTNRPEKRCVNESVELEENTKPSELIECFRLCSMIKVSKLLDNGLMSNFTDWNIFELHDICGHNTLLICTDYIFLKLNLYTNLNISQNKFLLFLQTIESGYLNIPYHSSLHATEVMINSFHFLINSNLIVSDLEKFIILLSAAAHDYKHPGYNSAFLVQTNHEIAVEYNNKTPLLEYMHATETLKLLSDEKHNGFLQTFTDSKIKYIKETIKSMIIGTAPEKHKGHMQKLTELQTINNYKSSDLVNDYKKDIMMIGLHCADIGSVCKSYDLFSQWWIVNILTEWLWFIQGDKEKELQLSNILIWKMMDKNNIHEIPDWLFQFIQSLFVPLLEKWSMLFSENIQFNVWCEQLKTNNRKLKEEGFSDHFQNCIVEKQV